MPRACTAVLALAAALALSACGDGMSGGETPGGGSMSGAEPAPSSTRGSDGRAAAEDVLRGTLPRLNGEPDDLASYRGKVVLVVNTASECGFTPQFDGLERLYERRRSDGLVVLGFPADDVANQEPRSDEQIAQFCEANFGVSFPMFAKSNVVDDPVNPLFERLSSALGEPSFNFNKYLLDRDGRPVERYDQSVEPTDPELTTAVDAELAKS
ncbi:MAG: glutathione peroxidase [Actinomycetota bacterium]|nr:glutathione peroxidase [Actinomycetota bacterium]